MDELEAEALISYDVVTDEARTMVVTISGELDMSVADELEAEVSAALAAPPTRLIVDIGALRFADSSAIALWVRWAAAVEDFELRHPTPIVRRVIVGMGLAQTLGMVS